MVNAYLPGELLIAKIITFLKDPKGFGDRSENYRSKCLSSIFMKVWDQIMLMLYEEKHNTVEMLF